MTCVYHSKPVPELKVLVVNLMKSLDLKTSSYQSRTKENTLNYPIKVFNNIHSVWLDGDVDECGSSGTNKRSSERSDHTDIFTIMKSEKKRLESYQDKWPLESIKPSDLASAGLFYLGISDRVQCAFCRGIITEWQEGDVPMEEHSCHFPMCPFLLEKNVGNVPIAGSNALQKAQINGSFAEKHISSDRISSSATETYAMYPNFNNVDKRIQSYINWPPSHIFRPKDLAECGLFYSGISDVVTCFCCGGSLGQWEIGDDPWVEHAKHYSRCAYVQFVKGISFIRAVQNSRLRQNRVNSIEENYVSSSNDILSDSVEENKSKIIEAQSGAPECTSSSSDQQSSFMCKICTEHKPRVAFIPCGHSLACPDCAKQLLVCPVCRQKIGSAVRIYFD